jgi:hypothetical protein
MNWFVLVGLSCLQVACAVRDVRCSGPLRPIKAASAAPAPAPSQSQSQSQSQPEPAR